MPCKEEIYENLTFRKFKLKNNENCGIIDNEREVFK